MLKSDAQLRLSAFLKTVTQASTRLLMLDYDGTLAPFRKERDQAFPYPGVVEIVQEILQDTRTRVVIISGREIADLAPLLEVQPLPEMWGVYGLEHRRPDGTIEVAHIEKRHLDALSDAHRWLEYQQLGLSAEHKTGSVALHWRAQTHCESERIRFRALLGWKPIADLNGLNILEFDGGIEIRVPGANKGAVVQTLLREIGTGVPAAYLGDDLTDEDAFRAIGDRGLSVLVRPRYRETAAQLWLKPPDEVLNFLTLWRDACRRDNAMSARARVGGAV